MSVKAVMKRQYFVSWSGKNTKWSGKSQGIVREFCKGSWLDTLSDVFTTDAYMPLGLNELKMSELLCIRFATYLNYILIHNIIIQSCWGVYWFHSVRLSIRLSVRSASRVRAVAPTVLIGSISCLYILYSNFRGCLACKVYYKMAKFEFLAIFSNL